MRIGRSIGKTAIQANLVVRFLIQKRLFIRLVHDRAGVKVPQKRAETGYINENTQFTSCSKILYRLK